ncbi:MAG TPA: aminotransferase class V-fold PLP-dependent enzyme [Ktedonobacterales bacterium]|nr:aminotransferase class V-fold PLP-dependent enzyme [Ktedonobacterales bacterium]
MQERVAQNLLVADQEKITAIRDEFPVLQNLVFLNAGTNGPIPRRSHDALVQYAQTELTEGRVGLATFMRLFELWGQLRASVATILGCDPAEIALTHNTTEGMNIALMGLDWQKGDELVTASPEHAGGLHPAYLIKQRYGAKLRMTQIGLPGVDPIEALQRVLTPRTKAVVLSHVSWASGMVLPIRQLADLAHQSGALFICDAAQSCGMVPSNVYDLGVDAYACSGQKWLCGPDGTGALFIRKDRLSDIQPTYFGYMGVKNHLSTTEGYFIPADGAQRYEAASLYPPALSAFATSLNWLIQDIGLDWVYQRIAALGQYAYQALSAIEGVTIHTPKDHMAGLIHFSLEGIAPADVTTRLRERNIIIRDTPEPAFNRASLGFYNTEAEIDQLASALADLRAQQPASL